MYLTTSSLKVISLKPGTFIGYTPQIISRFLDVILASFMLAWHKLVIWKEGASKRPPDWPDDQQGRATLWVVPPMGLVGGPGCCKNVGLATKESNSRSSELIPASGFLLWMMDKAWCYLVELRVAMNPFFPKVAYDHGFTRTTENLTTTDTFIFLEKASIAFQPF